MFLGRTAELATLERLYEKPGFQFAVLYGRRRVGKTSLMAEFCRNKKHVFYVSIEQNDKAALASFSEKILEALPDAAAYLDTFQSWESAFRYVAAQAREERIVLAIDEYPYLASGNASVTSILQRSIDTEMLQSNLFLMLCGSSVSFMENRVLGYKSPLYGRRTAQLRIEPFDYLDSALFFSGFGMEDKITAYGVAGGIPQYLGFISGEGSLRKGIEMSFLDPSGALFEEPSGILKQELREPAVYNSLISAIANGASRLNDIAGKAGEEANKSAKYLKTLMDLRILRRESPYGEEAGRRSIYRLADNMFRFWYRFVAPNVSNIESGMGGSVYERRVLPFLPDYMGRIFEDVCMQYISRRNKAQTLPIWVNGAGRWWGGNPREKRQEEIDIVAAADNSAIFGECKWRNEPAGLEALESLSARSLLLGRYKDRRYMLFSRSGFTEGLAREAEKRGDVELVSLDMLFGRF